MEKTEFIVALTQHRYLGSVFAAYLIEKKEKFYTVKSLVKKRDLNNNSDYDFKPYEKELVELIEKYSDERLMRKFSRAKNVKEFFGGLETQKFDKYVIPHLEKCMFQITAILMLSPVRLLNKEVKYANLYDEDEIHVQPFFAKPVYYFERTETETKYRLRVFLGDKEVPLQNQNIKIITNNPCLMVHRGRLIAFEKLKAKKLMPFFGKDTVSVSNSIEDKYYAGFMLNTIRDFEAVAKGFDILEDGFEKQAVLSLERNLQYEPCLVLHYVYGDEKFQTGSARKTAVNLKKENNRFIFKKINRDFDWENNILEKIKKAGLKEAGGYFTLPGIEMLENEEAMHFFVNWLNENRMSLEKNGLHVSQEKLGKTYFTGTQRLEVKTTNSGDWFDVYATVHFGEFSFPFIKLKKYILNDIREFELPNGEVAVLPEEWFARYKGLIPFSKIQGEKMQFEKHYYSLLHNVLQESGDTIAGWFQQMAKKGEEITLPENLNANLRHYQKEGFQWMFKLKENRFGGCLADDMGLGKTLQTLTLLLKLKRPDPEIQTAVPFAGNSQLSLFPDKPNEGESQSASLVVLPTSLVHNWEAEIKKFTPSLKVYKHIGIQRKNAAEFVKASQFFDIILTTYGTVRNDFEMLAPVTFFYLALDESQYIKNPSSKTYRAIMELKSTHRLVLTGTPIENSLSDLWSQMNFLNKGILGNQAFFKRFFITPIEKHNNAEQQEKLRVMIQPFILRRTKEEVAKDLPPLMEQVIYCDMTDDQQKIYEKEKSIIRNTILSSIETEGMAKAGFVVLQGLTRLRQLANHPSLLKTDSQDDSGKFQEIFMMLENLMAENHKVLIFSSFVKHLELIEQQIKVFGWKYSKLTGQTTKREEVIRQFQEDPQNRIFLISLKAGGVGLNLTEADYVFIIDPWWNPAAENQAINRAHRIGQDKHVFVYRFITENSIEEKIQLLKNRKSLLADKFINSNNPFTAVSKEEIIELFK